MRSVRTRTFRWFRPEGEPSPENSKQQPVCEPCSRSGLRSLWVKKTGQLMLALAVTVIQPGCHGVLGDWLTRSSLVPGGLPPQSEPDIDFEMSEPEMTADADDN